MSHPFMLVLLCTLCTLAATTPLPADCRSDLAYLRNGVATQDTIYLNKALYRYTVSGRRETQRMLEELPALEATLGSALAEVGIPDWLKYLPLAESGLKSRAVSSAGAAGLWQIMPRTARSLGLKINRRVDERLDTHRASRAAARYLKELHTHFDDWLLALAAYNCGAGNVRKAQRRSGGYFYHEISRYLPRQTRRYIPRVLTIAQIAQAPANFGFEELNTRTPAVTVVVHSAASLREIATYYCISPHRLRRLNPGLLTGAIGNTQIPARILVPGEAFLRETRAGVLRIGQYLQADNILTALPQTRQESDKDTAVAWHNTGSGNRFWQWWG